MEALLLTGLAAAPGASLILGWYMAEWCRKQTNQRRAARAWED